MIYTEKNDKQPFSDVSFIRTFDVTQQLRKFKWPYWIVPCVRLNSPALAAFISTIISSVFMNSSNVRFGNGGLYYHYHSYGRGVVNEVDVNIRNTN